MPRLLPLNFSREPNCNGATPNPSSTIHYRRTLSSYSTLSPKPPTLAGLGLPGAVFDSRSASPTLFLFEELKDGRGESDAECWDRMLRLQREFHCYNSARLEAAVEVMERGGEVPIRE